jgi:hypothetical protein
MSPSGNVRIAAMIVSGHLGEGFATANGVGGPDQSGCTGDCDAGGGGGG